MLMGIQLAWWCSLSPFVLVVLGRSGSTRVCACRPFPVLSPCLASPTGLGSLPFVLREVYWVCRSQADFYY